MKFKICIITILIIWATTVNAYDNKFVHLRINETASRISARLVSILPQIGFPNGIEEMLMGKKIWRWFQDGGQKEDEPVTRTFNHFHDPTKGWEQAGFSGLFSGCSSLLWAQNSCSSANDKWSWQKARDYYQTALTAGSAAIREQNFADTFRALGQQMHLLSDASVPEHTRNDPHVFPLFDNPSQSFPQIGKGTYETWCKHNVDKLNTTTTALDYTITNNSLVSGLAPTSNFWDTIPPAGNTTTPRGLAEYTNFNFVSGDTIFTDFEYPQPPISFIIDNVVTKDGKIDKRVYFWGATSDGITINHLASTGYLWEELSQVSAFDMDDSRYELDEECFKDYASILVPKAISYSAGLLDYFFRGTIELSLPARGVYALAAPDGQFTEIRVRARNTTVSSEEMNNGSIQLAVKYNLSLADPYQSVLVDLGPDTYIVIPEKTSSLPDDQRIKAIPRDAPVELTFDLSANPLPLWAANVSLQVVYKGSLGNEADSVAVGYKDIAEPSPVDVYNTTDYTCLNGTWYRFDDPAAMAIVDSDEDGIADRSDIYPHTITNIAFLGGPANAGTLYATISNNLFSPGPLQPGQKLRMGYILSDYEFRYAFNENRTGLNGDPFGHATVNNWNFSGYGFRNDMSTQSGMYPFRGDNMWWGSGVIFINPEYNGTCSLDALNQLLGY